MKRCGHDPNMLEMDLDTKKMYCRQCKVITQFAHKKDGPLIWILIGAFFLIFAMAILVEAAP